MGLKRWSGVIAIEGVETRDHRLIDEFRWDPDLLPMNFSCQFQRAEGHDGADVTTATMDTITRVGNQILATGRYLDTPQGILAAKLLAYGALSAVSVTGGSYGDYREEILDQNGNIVSIEDYIDMDPEDAMKCRVRRHFGWLEIAGLTQVDVSAFPGARIALVDDEAETVTTDRLVASAAAVAGFPAQAFRKRRYTQPCRLSVFGPGEPYYGHLALRDQCHRSFDGQCINMDFDHDDLRDFHGGTALLDDGSLLSTGVITHADLHAPDGSFSHADLMRLIEDTGTQLGPCRAYIDEFGVQVAGVAHRDLTMAELDRVRAGTPSIDARRKNGQMKLFGAHVVNTGGLPVTEDRVDGTLLRLVASAAVGLEAAPAVPEIDEDTPLEFVAEPPCDCATDEGDDDLTVPELAADGEQQDGAEDLDLDLVAGDIALATLGSDLALRSISV